MSSFKSPARVRFPRSNVTGSRPDILAPGSMAVNWADKVIWVGDARGEAVRFTQKVEDWVATRSYAKDDLVIRGTEIYRSKEQQVSGPFVEAKWDRLTDSARAKFTEVAASDILSGGGIVSATGSDIRFAEGRGVIIDNTDIENETPTFVSWPAFTITATPPGEPWSVIALDETGTAVEIPASRYDAEFRRNHVELAALLWATNPSGIALVLDASIRTGGTAETYRDEYSVNGGAYRAEGVRPTPVPTTLSFGLTAGTVFAMGWKWRADPQNPNILDLPANPLVSFIRITQDGSVSGIVNTLDPDQWDNAGTLTPVPAGQFTIKYLYAIPDLSQVFVQYGQATYASAAAAANNLVEDYEDLSGILAVNPIMVLGAVIIGQGETDISNARIINAQRGAAPFGEITDLQDSDFYLLDGSRALQGTMDAGGNAIDNAVIDGGPMV